jgi:hypothetical protein
MPLKYNNFLIIVPVFLVLGIILSVFNFYLEKREMTWGLDSEIQSTLISTATFLKYDYSDSINIRALKEIIKHQKVKQFILLEDNRTLLHIKESHFIALKNPMPRDIFVENNIATSQIYFSFERFYMDISMNISDTNKTLIATLDVSDFKNTLNDALVKNIFIVFIMMCIGIFVSMFISMIVSAKIKDIHRIVNALADKEYGNTSELSKIKEFSDLGITLDIVKSILEEAFLKTKDTIIQEKLLCKEETVLEIYPQQHQRKSYKESKSLRIVIIVNTSSLNVFHHILEDERFFYFYYGEINTTKNDENHSLVTASILYYLEKLLLRKEAIDIDFINELYSLKSLTIGKIEKKTHIMSVFSLDKKENKKMKLTPQSKTLFYSSDEEDILFRERMQSYMQTYRYLSILDLSQDMILYENRKTFMIIEIM